MELFFKILNSIMFKKLHKFLSIIPGWAIALVCIVVFTNTVYFIHRYKVPYDGGTNELKNGNYYIKSVTKGSPIDIAGIKPGDLLLRYENIDTSFYTEDVNTVWNDSKVGDILVNHIYKRRQRAQNSCEVDVNNG